MFSKTWRVHTIFTNVNASKRVRRRTYKIERIERCCSLGSERFSSIHDCWCAAHHRYGTAHLLATARSVENLQRHQPTTGNCIEQNAIRSHATITVDERSRCGDSVDLRRMSIRTSIDLDHNAIDLQRHSHGEQHLILSYDWTG
jgi:hypothetical protein